MEHNRPEEHDHYWLVRHDPIYRLECRIAELEAQLEPAYSKEALPISEPSIETIWLVPKQQAELNQLKAHTLFLERKLNEHLDRGKRKHKY